MKKTIPIKTEPEIHRFLRRLKEWNPNYYVAAMIGISWGLRCSDILALRTKDVLAGEGSRIQIKDRLEVEEIKTGHIRQILVTEKMKDILYEHIKRSPGRINKELPLVLSRNRSETGERKPLSRTRLWAVISAVAKEIGIKGSIGTHSLRKTWAYSAWRDGIRVDVIQKELGHTSIEYTHLYACIPDTHRDDLYKKVNYGLPTIHKRPSKRNGYPQKQGDL